MMNEETKKRSIAKTLSWRVIATFVMLGCVWFFTGALAVSLAATVATALFNTVAYYVHERLWNRSSWGR